MRKVAGRHLSSALDASSFLPRPYVGKQGPKRRPVADRFWAKVDVVNDTTSCWRWLGAHNGRYGQFAIDGLRTELTHRVAFVLGVGPIPAGLYVCHHCDNPSCVRPNHLFLGTALDNMRDMQAKGRARRGRKAT